MSGTPNIDLRTVEGWFKDLPALTRVRAIDNTRPNIRSLDQIPSLGVALSLAFSWGNSPEGDEFWRAIALKAQLGKYPLPDKKVPRTDAELFTAAVEGGDWRYVVPVNFARKLERDLNAANAELAELRQDKARLVDLLQETLQVIESLCEAEPVGADDDPCGVNRAMALRDRIDAAVQEGGGQVNPKYQKRCWTGASPVITNNAKRLTIPQYIEVLKRVKDTVKTAKLIFVDDTTFGNKSTHANWGMCSGSAKHYPLAELHKFPQDFDQSGRVSELDPPAGHPCPMLDPSLPKRGGCFWQCRIFQGKRKTPTREEALTLIDTAIATAKGGAK